MWLWVKRFGKLFLILALMVHVFLVMLFFAPTTFLLSKIHPNLTLLQASEIPDSVQEALAQKKISLRSEFDEDQAFLKRMMFEILKIRRDHLMKEGDKLSFDLSLLNFGEGIISMEAASEYYFHKPLKEISDEEWQTLISLYQIFSK